MTRLLDAQTVAITMSLAGTFAPNEELYVMSEQAADLNGRILERTQAAGGLRADVVVDDLSLILEQVSSIRLGDEGRTRELRHRYLALILDGLRADGAEPLPGPPPAPEELGSRWAPTPPADARAQPTPGTGEVPGVEARFGRGPRVSRPRSC